MARITIEDCMEHVPNRFHLVRMAVIRAKQLKKGALPLLTSENNKQVVMSLREIAAGLVKPSELGTDAEQVEAVAEPIVEAAEAVQTEEAATGEAASEVESKESTPASEG
jgi:DNA-directed RNA polymerase subunit omega